MAAHCGTRWGPTAGIAVDGHWRFNPPAAVQIAKVMEPYNPLFFEEPCLSDNDEALATVRGPHTIPLATGERGYTRWAFWNMLKHNLVDIIQPDLCHAGGILETRKIAAMAETDRRDGGAAQSERSGLAGGDRPFRGLHAELPDHRVGPHPQRRRASRSSRSR